MSQPGDDTLQLEAFAAAWTALSRLLLRPPTQEDLDSVRDPELLGVWPLDRDEATAEGLALLAESDEDAEAVRRDHNRLFVGPGHVLAPPWESVHLTQERLLFDEPTHRVRAWYARYGLQAPKLNKEPDDHIGLELEFCAHMARLAIDTPDARSDIETDIGLFLTDHLSLWAFMFAELMVEHADTLFHRGVGRLLSGTVSQSLDTFATTGSGS